MYRFSFQTATAVEARELSRYVRTRSGDRWCKLEKNSKIYIYISWLIHQRARGRIIDWLDVEAVNFVFSLSFFLFILSFSLLSSRPPNSAANLDKWLGFPYWTLFFFFFSSSSSSSVVRLPAIRRGLIYCKSFVQTHSALLCSDVLRRLCHSFFLIFIYVTVFDDLIFSVTCMYFISKQNEEGNKPNIIKCC